MGIDRRNFVKIASLSSIGLVCKPAVDLLADVQIPEEKALKAKHWATLGNASMRKDAKTA